MIETHENFKQEYSTEQIQAFFERWQNSQPGTIERTQAWDSYCDARDQLKQGTSTGRRTFLNIGAN